MPRPLLLDLFCGAGGAAAGYHRAGWDVVGIDSSPQPHYPFEFIEADALASGVDFSRFAAIHASPPCHAYSNVTGRNRHNRRRYPDLLAATRALVRASGLPYVIENVVGAPLIDPIRLCGSSFSLDLRRHRLFESSVPLTGKPCAHGWQTPRFQSLNSRKKTLSCVVGVHGHTNYTGELDLRCAAMGIWWMTNAELTQAIPPAYTEWIGRQLLVAVGGDTEAV